MKITAICLTILLSGIFICTAAFARPTYVGSSVTPNIDAMNTTFGAGNWDHLTFANAMTSGLLSAGNDFIYIDGRSDMVKFMRFMDTNRTALENWVRNGGSLFISFGQWCRYKSCLPGDFDIGFDVTLHIRSNNIYRPNFSKPNSNIRLFINRDVTGTNLTGLIFSDTGKKIFLGEKDYGLGHLIIGVMGLSSWPQIH